MAKKVEELGTRRVTVRDTRQSISYLDKENKEVMLGAVTTSNFGNEDLRTFHFMPDPGNPWMYKRAEDGIQLGRGSAAMTFLNFADAQRPLVELGMALKDLYVSRAGAEMVATYIYPEGMQDDPWNWDHSLWDGRTEMDKVFPAISVRMTLTPGRLAALYQGGLFRLICTNGLMGELVGGWENKVRHIEGNVDEIEGILESMDNPSAMLHDLLHTQTSIATHGGLNRVLNVLHTYVNASAQAREAREELSPQWQVFKAEYTAFSPTTTPEWAMRNYLRFLDNLVEAEKDPTLLDLANAYTGAVNHRSVMDTDDRGRYWALNVAPQVIKATASLARLATIFAD